MKTIKRLTKIISVFLSILIIVEAGHMSIVAFAEEKAENIPYDTPYISDAIQDSEESTAEILYEIEEKRDEYTKVYKKNDGTNTALISASPLHYNEDGKWIDIDNTLKRINKNGQTVYTNTDNPVNIEFPETLSEDSGITVQNGDHSLTFSIDGAQSSSVNISDVAAVPESNGAELNTKSETATYNEVFPDTNIEYSIISNNIKENIIILDIQAVKTSYVFNIEANGLTASLNENGSVSFFNTDNDEVFNVPAPFMQDDFSAVYSSTGELIYASFYDNEQNLLEYVGGILSITKPAESSHDYETGITTATQDICTEKNIVTLKSLTDAFGRTKQKSIKLSPVEGSNSDTQYSSNIITSYAYKNSNTTASSQVNTIMSEVLNGDTVTSAYGFSYDYDGNGNITHEYSANADGTRGSLRYRYSYDEANQLIRVDDNVQSKTYTYQYDKGGNRVSEKIYAYTLSETLGTVQKEIESEYNYIVWNDRLSKYDGKTVTYDSVGNPTAYDGKTFVWEGKQLKSVTAADGTKTEFEYDANGLRVMKKQYDEDGRLSYYVEYLWQDGKITTQYLTLMMYITQNNVTTEYPLGPLASKIFYDQSGTPQGFSFCGETVFTFVRNLQGDVIAAVDSEGNPVIEYSYDPWGNIEYHFIDEDLSNDEQGVMMFTALCPLTYRGYNYDFTTGLYYLQSRYYNPEWGRFINCDDTNILLATQGETHGANLFAYCNNNPVNRVDNEGKRALNISNMNVSVTIYDGYNVDKMDGTIKGYFSSILSGAKNGWIGHAEINLGNLTCSYGVYQRYNKYTNENINYGKTDKIKGCPASLIMSFDRMEWEAYNFTVKKRLTREISISVSYEEFIGLFIFYCLFIFYSDEDNIFAYNYKGNKNNVDKVDIDNPATDWIKIQLTEGEYKTYKYTEKNCCTVILDALEFAMPERYKKALHKSGMLNDTLLGHPETLAYFLKSWE